MSSWGVASITYGVVGLGALRPLAGHFAWAWNERARLRDAVRYRTIHNEEEFRTPDGEKWFGAYVLALSLLVLWPAAFIVAVVGRFGPTIGAEKAQRAKEREEYIAKLERELGIG